MRRRLSRREQLVRGRSRAKNEIHAVLVRRLVGRPLASDLFGLALVVEGDIDRETLEVLCRGGLGTPPGMQLCRGGDRRFDRHATLTIRDDLIAAPSHLHELTDRQVEPLHDSCHGSMVAP